MWVRCQSSLSRETLFFLPSSGRRASPALDIHVGLTSVLKVSHHRRGDVRQTAAMKGHRHAVQQRFKKKQFRKQRSKNKGSQNDGSKFTKTKVPKNKGAKHWSKRRGTTTHVSQHRFSQGIKTKVHTFFKREGSTVRVTFLSQLCFCRLNEAGVPSLQLGMCVAAFSCPQMHRSVTTQILQRDMFVRCDTRRHRKIRFFDGYRFCPARTGLACDSYIFVP